MSDQERINDLIYMISPVEGEPRLPKDWADEERKLVFRWGLEQGMFLDGALPEGMVGLEDIDVWRSR